LVEIDCRNPSIAFMSSVVSMSLFLGPKLCSLEDIESNPRGVNPSYPCKFLHCHINFLATCFDEELHDQPTNLYFADQPIKLFFAECSHSGDDSWCAPVDCSPDAGML